MAQATEIFEALRELKRAAGRLPIKQQAEIGPLLLCVEGCFQQEQRILKLVQEALSDLRLDMKYLIFDLEATRRERDEFKTKLDNFNV